MSKNAADRIPSMSPIRCRGVITTTLIEVIQKNLSRMGSAKGNAEPRNTSPLRLSLHCLNLAREELAGETLTTSNLLEWIYGLIQDDFTQNHWCRVATAFHQLGLLLVQEAPKDKKFRDFCKFLDKSIHEYQMCRTFCQEQEVRRRLKLDSQDLLAAAGICQADIREHLSRSNAEKEDAIVQQTRGGR